MCLPCFPNQLGRELGLDTEAQGKLSDFCKSLCDKTFRDRRHIEEALAEVFPELPTNKVQRAATDLQNIPDNVTTLNACAVLSIILKVLTVLFGSGVARSVGAGVKAKQEEILQEFIQWLAMVLFKQLCPDLDIGDDDDDTSDLVLDGEVRC